MKEIRTKESSIVKVIAHEKSTMPQLAYAALKIHNKLKGHSPEWNPQCVIKFICFRNEQIMGRTFSLFAMFSITEQPTENLLQKERIEAFHAGYHAKDENPALECQHRRSELICGVRKCFDCGVDL